MPASERTEADYRRFDAPKSVQRSASRLPKESGIRRTTHRPLSQTANESIIATGKSSVSQTRDCNRLNSSGLSETTKEGYSHVGLCARNFKDCTDTKEALTTRHEERSAMGVSEADRPTRPLSARVLPVDTTCAFDDPLRGYEVNKCHASTGARIDDDKVSFTGLTSASQIGVHVTRHCVKAAGGAGGKPFTKANLFSRLSLFFHHSPGGVKQDVDFDLLTSLFQDMIARQLFALVELVGSLELYCEGKPMGDPQCRIFVTALLRVVGHSSSADLDEAAVTTLSRLILRHGSFEECLVETCKCHAVLLPSTSSNTGSGYMKLLNSCLNNITNHYPDSTVHTINSQLSFGETPLTVAARSRCPPVMMLLLRHGADVMTSWLGYSNIVEVLFFAPHQVNTSGAERRQIELCWRYLSRVMRTIDVKSLEEKNASGYQALHPGWRQLMPKATRPKEPATLRQLCRLRIRDCLKDLGRLPEGVLELPLPAVLRQYVDLMGD